MNTLFGLELPTPVNFVIAFVVVLGLIGAATWAVRRFGVTRLEAAARGRQPRLAVIDSAAVDGRRKLIIIRRDNVEHLLMVGGASDIVVETNIVRGGAAATREPSVRAGLPETMPRAMALPDPTPWPLQPNPRSPRRRGWSDRARSTTSHPGRPTRSRSPPPPRRFGRNAPPMRSRPRRARRFARRRPLWSTSNRPRRPATTRILPRWRTGLKPRCDVRRRRLWPLQPRSLRGARRARRGRARAPARRTETRAARRAPSGPTRGPGGATKAGVQESGTGNGEPAGPPGQNIAARRFAACVRLTTAAAIALLVSVPAQAQDISINFGQGAGLTERVIQLIALLTVLSLAPSILVMMTSFTRIVVVLSLLRTALGTATAPPNAVMVALAMFLTAFVMGPAFQTAYDSAVKPLLANEITTEQAFERGSVPFRAFMLKNVREKDLKLFNDLSREPLPASPDATSLRILIPAFMISELRRAFEIGFLLFLPFLIIDLVVASVLMSMGMMMLPPVVVSLPFKLIFFVLVDGWSLVAGSLVQVTAAG